MHGLVLLPGVTLTFLPVEMPLLICTFFPPLRLKYVGLQAQMVVGQAPGWQVLAR